MALTLVYQDNLREAAALKNLLASAVTRVAVVLFVANGAISWELRAAHDRGRATRAASIAT